MTSNTRNLDELLAEQNAKSQIMNVKSENIRSRPNAISQILNSENLRSRPNAISQEPRQETAGFVALGTSQERWSTFWCWRCCISGSHRP